MRQQPKKASYRSSTKKKLKKTKSCYSQIQNNEPPKDHKPSCSRDACSKKYNKKKSRKCKRGCRSWRGPRGYRGIKGDKGAAAGSVGPAGAQGVTGTTGATGIAGADSPFIETLKIGDIETLIPFNAGSGNNQAIGALAFDGRDSTIRRLAAFVTQMGTNTGTFQMAVLEPVTGTTASVIGGTTVATTITPGLFILPLTAPVTLSGNIVYYLAVYIQINGSFIGGRTIGTGMEQLVSRQVLHCLCLPGSL
nr:hypothetical protein [Paenibacillus xylanexedens]